LTPGGRIVESGIEALVMNAFGLRRHGHEYGFILKD
jgi:hypothetical protein